MNGGSSYINLPKCIAAKHACINVMNLDERCFLWSLLSALYPVQKKPHRPSQYLQNITKIFNISNIRFPTPLCDIEKFESQNDISINVYGLEMVKKDMVDVVGPLHFTKSKKVRHVNLLFFKDGERSHYCWIKDLSRLVSSKLSKDKAKKHICDRCLQYFGTTTLLERHEVDCAMVDAVKIELPGEDDKWLKFKNFSKKIRHPFVIYADTESLTIPIFSCQPDPTSSYTNPYQKHETCAIAFQVVCEYDNSLSYYQSYRGPNAAFWFLEQLKALTVKIALIYKNIAPMTILTDEQWQDFNNTQNCHICKKPFCDDDLKVRDHNHLTGAYNGAAHNSCNLNYQLPDYVPVFFHNLTGYDSHMIIRELGCDDKSIFIIPATEERYITFSKKTASGISLRFLDSFR